MSSEEIRRRRTADPEMDAINVISQALDGLDRNQCERVLRWAGERYVKFKLPGLELADMKGVNNFMTAAAQMASRLNMANPEELLKAMAKVADELPVEGEHVPR